MATVNNNSTVSGASLPNPIENSNPNKTNQVAQTIFECGYCGQKHTNIRNHLHHHWCLLNSDIQILAQEGNSGPKNLGMTPPAPLSCSPPLKIISQMK